MKEPSPGAPLPDEELVSRARNRDSDAMDELVRRHHASAFRVALGILKDEDAASDAAQDAFIKAIRGLDRFRGEASFRTWLLSIAANEARGLLRKAGRRREIELDMAGAVAVSREAAEDTLEAAQETDRLKAFLEELPEKQRQAVTLRIFEGLSFREVGALIGSSEGAARVNYHHGIRRIREMLG